MIDIFLFAPWIGVMGLGVWIMWLYKKVPVKLFTGTKKDEMILMQITEDGKAIFGKAKIEAGMAVKETGGIRNKQSFSYLLTPYSTVTEPRSKTTIGITYGNYGVVLSPSAHDKGNALKAAGFGDFDDLEKVKKEVNGEKLGYNRIENPAKDGTGNQAEKEVGNKPDDHHAYTHWSSHCTLYNFNDNEAF